jgi:hypothetical protein
METIETALRPNFTSGEGMWSLSGSKGVSPLIDFDEYRNLHEGWSDPF